MGIRYRQCHTVEKELPSGLAVRLFYSLKTERVVYIQLHRGTGWERKDWTDTYHGIGFEPRGSVWKTLSDVQDFSFVPSLPPSFGFDVQQQCFFYSIDGETFWFPASGVAETNRAIEELERAERIAP